MSIRKSLEEKIWAARIAIYIVALVELGMVAIIEFIKPGEDVFYDLIIAASFAGIFVVFGIWAKEKPFPALTTTVIIYLLAIILDVSYHGMNIFRGIIFRGTIFIFLIRGIDAARQLQQLEKNQGVISKKDPESTTNQ